MGCRRVPKHRPTTLRNRKRPLPLGFCGDALAQVSSLPAIHDNDNRISHPANAIMTHFEGSGCALMVLAGGVDFILATLSRRYKLALFLLGLAGGTFFARSFMGSFFDQ